MAHLIYLPQIAKDTWLHWTMSGNASRLRDFRTAPAREYRDYKKSDIELLLRAPDSAQQPAPPVAYKNERYWRDQIRLLNIESHLIEPSPQERLLASFVSQVERELGDGVAGLKGVLDRWRSRLGNAQEKRSVFNHWDIDDATARIGANTGLGWTAQMLEHSRERGSVRFMDGIPCPVFLAAMELSVGISSRRNPFCPGSVNSVRLDGLGVCSDKCVAVFEVKGPQDDLNPWPAILQGVLGALAVHAKREYILRLLRNGASRRPSIKGARIPVKRPSIRVFILISSVDSANRERPFDAVELRDRMQLLVQSSRVIQEIALFRIPPTAHLNLISLPQPEAVCQFQP